MSANPRISKDMEVVQFGTMLKDAFLIEEGVNSVWKSHVRLANMRDVVAYSKVLPKREIFVECCCAVIARHMGLPVPRPLIVKPTPHVIEQTTGDFDYLAFGSVDAGYPSFRRSIEKNPELFWKKLGKFKKLFDVGAFDEWIANSDRHPGNVLFDGKSKFVFIDHGRAISCGLASSKPSSSNQIIERFYTVNCEMDKYRIIKDVQKSLLPQYEALSVSLLSGKVNGTLYLDDVEAKKVVSFLDNRTTELINLLRLRLEIKQMEIQYEKSG